MADRETPILYTCYACNKNFSSKKCPKCGRKGAPIYRDQIEIRPNNNPTDFDAYLKKKGK